MNLTSKSLFISLILIISSCKKLEENNQNLNNLSNDSIILEKTYENRINSSVKDTLLYSNENLEVYQEYITRGDGIVNLSFENKLEIYNLDGTVYGSIIKDEESGYKFDLPKKIVARNIVPDFDQFSFDSKNPEKTGADITIFINKEPKNIKKGNIDYSFISWDEYIMKTNFKCLDDNDNIFKALKIIDVNTVFAKTTNIEDCGGEKISSKVIIEKEIKWRNNDIMNVEFYNCD